MAQGDERGGMDGQEGRTMRGCDDVLGVIPDENAQVHGKLLYSHTTSTTCRGFTRIYADFLSSIAIRRLRSRASGLLGNLLGIDGIEIKAVRNIVPTRVWAARQRIVSQGQAEPASYSEDESDFENLCKRDDIDLASLGSHSPMRVPEIA